jgi:hypothetical protein
MRRSTCALSPPVFGSVRGENYGEAPRTYIAGVVMTRLTSVYGSFGARVMAARLQSEGFDVQLRGPLDGPYAVTVGEMARIDVFVPDEQAGEASLLLLVDEVDEADEFLDDDRPPIRDRRVPRWCVAVALVLLTVATVPAFHAVHQVLP